MSDVDSLSRILAEIERRLRAVERGSQMPYSSVESLTGEEGEETVSVDVASALTSGEDAAATVAVLADDVFERAYEVIDAQNSADDAAEAAEAAQTAADAAAAAAVVAQQKADAAQAAGDTAAQNAAAAQSTAAAAQSAADAVTAEVAGIPGDVKAGQILASSIKAGTITAASGVIGSIDAAKITVGKITAAQMETGTITAASGIIAEVDAATITVGKITAAQMQTGTITAASGIIGSLDAAKITVGQITSSQIAAQAIKASHLLVGDASNMAEISSVAGSVAWGAWTSSAADASGWISRTGTRDQYFMFRNQKGPLPFKTGDRIRLTFEAYASATVAATPTLWTYDNGVNPSQTLGAAMSITTTPQTFATEADVTVDTNGRLRFLIGLNGAGLSTTDVFVRNVRAYRMGAGELVVDGSVTASKIAATAIDGKTITGATVRTSATGARVMLDSTGFKAYDASNVNTVTISAADGSVSIAGKMRTALSGRRIEIGTTAGEGITSAGSMVFYNGHAAEANGWAVPPSVFADTQTDTDGTHPVLTVRSGFYGQASGTPNVPPNGSLFHSSYIMLHGSADGENSTNPPELGTTAGPHVYLGPYLRVNGGAYMNGLTVDGDIQSMHTTGSYTRTRSPGAMVRKTSVDASSNAVYLRLDFDGHWSGSNQDSTVWSAAQPSRFYAPEPGRYSIGGNIVWAANATGYRIAALRINSGGVNTGGSTLNYWTAQAVPSTATSLPIALTDVYLNAGDYLEVFATQNSGGALNVGTGNGITSTFSMSWIGPA